VNYSAVASVLKTRLKNNIALWADATTCYAYKIPSSKCTPDFIGDHIRETNDYNTRILRWLPRWPISNVTADIYRASLDASDDSQYWYYLHDNNWVLRLSRNLEEHNAKVQQYLR
jgi:cell division protein YceG involved in septum cleavage